MNRKTTMQDIADKLRLSKNSISQALTGKPGVSDETRRLIMQTADDMGYVYGKRAQQPNSTYSGPRTIALIASNYAFSMKSFFGDIYLSVDKELKQRGMELIIQSISPEDAASLTLPPFIQQRAVDGILILSHITTPYIRAVLETGIPSILIDHHHPDLAADSILTNNRFSAYEAIRHLAGLGHRDIGYMGNIRISPSYYERLEGMRLAAFELGIELKEQWIVTTAKEESGEIRSLLEGMADLPTAWFCVNDGFGFMVNSALQQMGMNVPEDISVVSFDNGYLSRLATPPITTVDVDLQLYARCAVEKLISRLNDSEQPRTETLLSTRLLVRGSTGPVVLRDSQGAPNGR
ncbi:LacI family DNA-binding transcriptional regulator [Paenibacillus glycanilyticus]|uniref:LacI family DNA-binding transcriptional regulator n=1 Tax=Paenibacillus glycanilyticus TaxID=126569 RepID=UPI002042112C|nr:LacI family DNA-binding transcriptional regulator [Paenibacillus glycanilyticus]MCM3630658.1 LacI family DNA-binding transcriptional regulator [Paenibacillus glycanilyticus]